MLVVYAAGSFSHREIPEPLPAGRRRLQEELRQLLHFVVLFAHDLITFNLCPTCALDIALLLLQLLLCAALLFFAGAAYATDVTWFAPTNAPNSNASWPGGTSFSNNFGVVFNAGTGSTEFEIDWIKLGLNTSTSTSGAGSIKVALHGTANSTAYFAVATSTQHALDVVLFTAPTTTSTLFELMLRSPELPNISSFSMSPSTSYSLILYAPTGGSWGMGRTTGFASNTTNDFTQLPADLRL